MQDVLQDIIQVRAGGRVERCHGIPHHGSYSNAKHQWGTAMLMRYLWPHNFPHLGLICLVHDIPEAWVGDVPHPALRFAPSEVKQYFSSLETLLLNNLGLPSEHNLTNEDFAKLKACDLLEFYLWCKEETLLGNRFVEEGMLEVERYIESGDVVLPSPADELWDELQKRDLLPKQQGVIRELMDGPGED